MVHKQHLKSVFMKEPVFNQVEEPREALPDEELQEKV